MRWSSFLTPRTTSIFYRSGADSQQDGKMSSQSNYHYPEENMRRHLKWNGKGIVFMVLLSVQEFSNLSESC